MANLDANKTSITNMSDTVSNWSVSSGTIDEAGNQDETYWDYTDSNQRLGYYNLLPELKKAIDILAMYATGKGWDSPNIRTRVMLDNITGWGEDTFESIVWNLLVQKKIFGDAFAEIIRDKDNRLLNIKPLYTGNMRVVTNRQGIIMRYEHRAGQDAPKQFKPEKILHLVNERIANQIHGTSVVDSVKWVIDAKNEALDTMRKVQRRMLAMGTLTIDTEDLTKIATIKAQFQDAVDKGEVLVLQKGVTEIEQAPANQTLPLMLEWIRYLDDFSYRALGVPLVLAGGSGGSEGSDKTGFLTFDQVYLKEQRELESDLWNQLAIRVLFNKPATINPQVVDNEGKNTSQTGFQPKDAKAGVTKE
jgi:hypothetical protein